MIYDNYNFRVPKEKRVRVIIDTDAKNEADDQFAIVQALLSPKFDIRGLIAAHFGTDRCTDGMEKSYEELKIIMDYMNRREDELLYHGAKHALADKTTPIESEGAKFIIREAMSEEKSPLYVLFLGPLTDLASAYLMEPAIADRMTAIWIGGGSYPDGGEEFNLKNDINAANVVFGSAIPVWQIPKNVYEMMPVSMAELECRVYKKGRIGKYLFEQLVEHSMEEGPRKSPFRTGESWVLGDSPAVGLLLYEHRFEYDWIQAPYITGEMQYETAKLHRPIRVYKRIDSRFILEDLYAKLELFAEKNSNY